MVIRDGVVVSYHTCNGGTTWARAFLTRALGPTFVSDPFNGRPANDVLLREVCESFSSQLYLFSLSEWGYSQLSPGIVIEPLLNAPVPVRRDVQLHHHPTADTATIDAAAATVAAAAATAANVAVTTTITNRHQQHHQRPPPPQGEGGPPAEDLDLALLPAEDLKVRLCQVLVVLTVKPLPSS